MPPRSDGAWETVQRNPTYRSGALSDAEGRAIIWHSPAKPHSSQVFCVSAFGGLRFLPDRDTILRRLFAGILQEEFLTGPWHLTPEHIDRQFLNEMGGGNPSSIDIFCSSPRAVVCLESKFKRDAADGFGGCSQPQVPRKCAGFYGPGSDLHTGSGASCRLEIQDGRRTPRLYWRKGRAYFIDAVFRPQAMGERCPFAGPNFQVMRNFLFAAAAVEDPAPSNDSSASERLERAFGVLCIAPKKTCDTAQQQVFDFKIAILQSKYQRLVGLETYETLVSLLLDSPHEESRALGSFLQERMETLL